MSTLLILLGVAATCGLLGFLVLKQSNRADHLVEEAEHQSARLRLSEGLVAEEHAGRIEAERDARANRQSLEASVCGIAALDATGRYVTVNPAFALIQGKSAVELVGQDWFHTVAPENLDRMRAAYAKAIQDGKVEIEISTRRHDGSTVVEELVLVSSRDDSGRFLGHHVFATDVSAQVAAVSALSTARDAAVQAAGVKTDFLANMSHEIRTPMNGVVGMLDLLRGTALDPVQTEYVDLAMVSIKSLLRVVNDILDFSKIESGKMTLELEPFDLRRMMESICEMVAPRAGAKGLEVVLEYPTSMPRYFIGDEGRLAQVVTNLVENALKFTHRGRIVLAAQQRTGSAATSTVSHLTLSVMDTGVGIPASRLSEMFEKFTQADVSTTRVYGGTGLGLAICKQLLALMHGKLEVISEPGLGSSFIAKLDLLKDPHPPTPAANPPGLSGVRLLVIDDDVESRAVLCEMLAGHQLRPSSADSEADALRYLNVAVEEKDPFQVVLVDQVMSGLSGPDLALKIRSDPRFAESRLVLLAVPDGKPTGVAGGPPFAAHVTKPVRPDRLMETLSQVLGVAVAPKAATPASVVAAASLRPCRVLAVEDNEVNAFLLRILLERLECTVEQARTGSQAVEFASRIAYDLIFMDCQMPGMDGYEATQQIRASETGKGHVPIVALTARAMEGDRERCLAAGMDDYLTKPLRPADIAAAVANWGRRARVSTQS